MKKERNHKLNTPQSKSSRNIILYFKLPPQFDSKGVYLFQLKTLMIESYKIYGNGLQMEITKSFNAFFLHFMAFDIVLRIQLSCKLFVFSDILNQS